MTKHLYTTEEKTHLDQYISKQFGKYAQTLTDEGDTSLDCDIHIIEPTTQKNYYTLVTSGMGGYTMNIPEDEYDSPNAELLIHLPPNWKVDSKEERWQWPIEWLRRLANLPIERKTYLGWGHTIPTGGDPLAGTIFQGFLLIAADIGEEHSIALLPNDKKIAFYHVIPMYEEELLFNLERNIPELLERFNETGIPYPPIVNLDRPNTCADFKITEHTAMLDDVKWNFNHPPVLDLMSFFDAVYEYNYDVGNDLEDFNPYAVVFHAKQVKIIYDTHIQSRADINENEALTDEAYLDGESQNGFYKCRIVATFKSRSGSTIGALELLWMMHKTLGNKEPEKNILFQGLDLMGREEDGTPVVYLLRS